ncbi:hypothetical protein HEL69_016420 [Escherichia coli]|uniref:hypothetical protein n=1 Tax=Escherichia coli TaxID=562 RepID=UPI000BE364B3|nr:hypothetical protein [Escherichia coli]MBB7851695.1 hypothetical protein [Escherichia coli]
MTEHASSPGHDENNPTWEIIRQKQSETRERLEAELAKKRRTTPAPQLIKPKKYALEEFLDKYPRRLKAGKTRPPG